MRKLLITPRRCPAGRVRHPAAAGFDAAYGHCAAGGHSGGEPLDVQVKNAAEELAFLWWQLR